MTRPLPPYFGRQQLTAATILYEEGAAGVQKWTSAVDESGFATRTAATKMDNLKGDVEQLKGAIDSAFIQSGSGGTTFLRSLAQDATGAIDSFNSLSPAVQQFAFKGAAIAAARPWPAVSSSRWRAALQRPPRHSSHSER